MYGVTLDEEISTVLDEFDRECYACPHCWKRCDICGKKYLNDALADGLCGKCRQAE